jgi:hypothetical protein
MTAENTIISEAEVTGIDRKLCSLVTTAFLYTVMTALTHIHNRAQGVHNITPLCISSAFVLATLDNNCNSSNNTMITTKS